MKATTHWYRWFVVTINLTLLLCVLMVWLLRTVFKVASRATRGLA